MVVFYRPVGYFKDQMVFYRTIDPLSRRDVEMSEKVPRIGSKTYIFGSIGAYI